MLETEGWWDLSFWGSSHWKTIQERLDRYDRSYQIYNPSRSNLFRALDIVGFHSVRCAFITQDPYPNPKFASGLAFHVNPEVDVSFSNLPPTLLNIYEEYERDLHCPVPINGSLYNWCNNGVLLWNSIPCCLLGKPLSCDWKEWYHLNTELIDLLSLQGIVFVFFGSVAQRYQEFVNPHSKSISVSHPSPRASRFSHHPFVGSRIFTRTNDYLVQLGKEPIDWRLL